MTAETAILVGDARDWITQLDDESVNCVVTSPPYFGMRDYDVDGQFGAEPTLDEYIEALATFFEQVRRVLRRDGIMWLNIGDCYVGTRGSGGKGDEHGQRKRIPISPEITRLKRKDLVGVPWRLALAVQGRDRRTGWYLRSDVIWNKTDAMPVSIVDRPTTCHEYIFMFSRQQSYYFDQDAVRERAASDRCPNPKGRNVRSVWTFPTAKFREGHFASFPPELASRCIKAGCPEGGVVLDPFLGTGTTAMVAARLGRRAIGIEMNPKYVSMSKKRVQGETNGQVRLILPGQSLENVPRNPAEAH